jgi:protein-disulfide isomerase
MTMRRRRALMDVVTTVVILATCGLLVWANRARIWPPHPPSIPPPAAPVSLEDAPVFFKGDAAAPVVLVMYSDYQCPFCGRFERDTLPAIEREYVATGKVRVAMRQHPLERLHPQALAAAVAAVCSGRQGHFWQMHAALFAHQQDLGDARITTEAKRLELDLVAFASCRAADPIRESVQAEGGQADAFGLMGTPAFLIGRVQPDGRVKITSVVSGARPRGEFRRAIDEALKERQTSRSWIAWAAGGLAIALPTGILIPLWRRRA